MIGLWLAMAIWKSGKRSFCLHLLETSVNTLIWFGIIVFGFRAVKHIWWDGIPIKNQNTCKVMWEFIFKHLFLLLEYVKYFGKYRLIMRAEQRGLKFVSKWQIFKKRLVTETWQHCCRRRHAYRPTFNYFSIIFCGRNLCATLSKARRPKWPMLLQVWTFQNFDGLIYTYCTALKRWIKVLKN